MVRVIMSAAMLQKLVDFFDGYSDENIRSCKFISKSGIKGTFEIDTDMDAATTASYVKRVFGKKCPEASAMYYSVQPDEFFNKGY